MYSDNRSTSLRKLYNKILWTYIGVSVLSVAASILLVYRYISVDASPLPLLVAAGIGLALAAVEYFAERLLYKRGKKANLFLFGFTAGILLSCVLLDSAGLLGGYAYLVFPVMLGFLFNRPLIPAIGLLRDQGRLRGGNPCETVGRMQSGSRRWAAAAGRSSYLLFEDELTGEVHLLLAGSMDPARRYRVLYLPHSGLAVGEVIPDGMELDPFGNPLTREPQEAEETCAEDRADASDGQTPPTAEELDPNSPARRKAAKFALASSVCRVLTFVGFGITLVGAILLKETTESNNGLSFAVLAAVPFLIVSSVLSDHFKKKDRRLRCTRLATARCVDTVRRKSGKYSRLHPIVGFEVDGVTYTAELSVSCSRDSVGEAYTIYYDPLDPQSVRAE